ncbi:hypothetical protein Hypma_016600 [Hypsizygus marmoreus]|uniref:Uncharacterized protein n=1 Tax=Hypsizygus marmoreus TaxID=39966 RepID=A0A369J072_HYPMA|nr:hypothetical protein Hypma_016600 [Hypsizygus marmoreus]
MAEVTSARRQLSQSCEYESLDRIPWRLEGVLPSNNLQTPELSDWLPGDRGHSNERLQAPDGEEGKKRPQRQVR